MLQDFLRASLKWLTSLPTFHQPEASGLRRQPDAREAGRHGGTHGSLLLQSFSSRASQWGDDALVICRARSPVPPQLCLWSPHVHSHRTELGERV